MHNDLRIALSLIVVVAVLLTSSCTASFQIGGKDNTTEQNRHAPVSNRSEQAPPAQAYVQPTPAPTIEASEAEQTQVEQQLDDERRAVEEERARLDDARQAQEAERQRLKEEADRLEQQRAAQQIYVLQQQQRLEEEKLVELRNRRENEERRLS